MLTERVGVLVAAAGASWEVEALRLLGAPATRAVLVKRCMDLPDMLAAAATGQARVAVVADGLTGLDADSVDRLTTLGVATVVVTDGDAQGALPGVAGTLTSAELARLSSLVPEAAAQAAHDDRPRSAPTPQASGDEPERAVAEPAEGRVVAVWGPAGAPGRTTVAVNLAAELAGRGHDTMLVDADCYGGTVAQHLGVLDEVSGLLASVRLANAGRLDVTQLAALARTVEPGLRVLTGLPRADRWAEVRPAALDRLLETCRDLCRFVVLDLGFSLEQDSQAYGSTAPQRNHMTTAGLDHADEVVVVGAADPVGLARLARGLVELPEVVPAATTRVVVNRVRPSLGWGEQEVRAMVEGFVMPASMHFLPDDPGAADRALVAGRPVAGTDGALPRAVAGLADAVTGQAAARSAAGRSRLRRRRAGRAR